MSIPVISIIRPLGAATGVAGTHPVAQDIDLLGGLQTVSDHTARNAIPNTNRKQGMLVFTISDTSYWELNAPPWTGVDGDWTAATFGGGTTIPVAAASSIVTPVSGKTAFYDASNNVALSTKDGYGNVQPVQTQIVINVKDYPWGAEGDGITDDTAAIQAAIDSLSTSLSPYTGTRIGGGTIFFPSGDYLISSPLDIQFQYPTVMKGGGRDSTNIIQTTLGAIGVHAHGDGTNPTFSNFTLEDLTITQGHPVNVAVNNTWLSSIRMPLQHYNLNDVVSAPGQTNRLLKCTSAGTTGKFLPFGQLWSGVPSNPSSNPSSVIPQPIAFVDGNPDIWLKEVIVAIGTPGALGTFDYEYSFDGIIFSGTQTTTAHVTRYSITHNLHINFQDGYNYVAGSHYCSPCLWQGMSVIVGDVITDGTCQWTVIDGGAGFYTDGTGITINRCNFYNHMVGITLDSLTEGASISDCNIQCVAGIWIATANENRNAATDIPIIGNAANFIHIENILLGIQTVGIADSGGASHQIDNINFEGPADNGYYAWITAVNAGEFTNWLTEGSPNGVFIGGQGVFTGSVLGPSLHLGFRNSAINPGGFANRVITSMGTNPPAVTISGFAVTAGNQLAIAIEIATTGPRGTATFNWSQDGDNTFTATGVLTAATVVLGSTGLTVNFPTGTYTNDNVYLCLGNHLAVFECSTGSFASVDNLEIENCSLGNAGSFGFINPGVGVGGLRFIDNTLNNEAAFFQTATSNIYDPGQNDAMITSQIQGLNPGWTYNVWPPVINGVDIFGQFGLRAGSIRTLVPDSTHTNNNLVNPQLSSLEISNVNGSFSITGIASGTEGQMLRLVNMTELDGGGPYQMTIKHQSSSSTDINRIICPNGTDLVIPTPPSGGFSAVTLRYSKIVSPGSNLSRWIVDNIVSNHPIINAPVPTAFYISSNTVATAPSQLMMTPGSNFTFAGDIFVLANTSGGCNLAIQAPSGAYTIIRSEGPTGYDAMLQTGFAAGSYGTQVGAGIYAGVVGSIEAVAVAGSVRSAPGCTGPIMVSVLPVTSGHTMTILPGSNLTTLPST